jgi:hypothetical protein
MILTGNKLITGGGGPCPSATLSTTNPSLTDLGFNGLRGEVRATTRLNHGTAS